MKKILILGAGRSCTVMIDHLLDHAKENGHEISLADQDLKLAEVKLKGRAGKAFGMNVEDLEAVTDLVSQHDLVISMLPAFMHFPMAKICLAEKKHLLTASYISPEMAALDKDVKANDLIFLNECGLDPGIDHMSAMEIIRKLKDKGAEIYSFKSYTGGLVAPESNNNPWGYKFTWNPRNVILAGQSTATFLSEGKYKYTPYNRLFSNALQCDIPGGGKFDGYPNRDSLSYRKPYGLENIETMIRGTFRYPGYCQSWQILANLGMCDDTWKIADSKGISYAQFTEAFLPSGNKSVLEKLCDFAGCMADDEKINRIIWTGLLSDQKISLDNASPAMILQSLLEDKWKLEEGDKDMIVMYHQFRYRLDGKKTELTSSLIVKGEDMARTAMAATVGLPLALAAENILNGKITQRGVHMPIIAEIYEPILRGLEELGIRFVEAENEIQ